MEPLRSPFDPINLLVVLRRAPRLVPPAGETPQTILYLPAVHAHAGYGSILSSHMLLFEGHHHHSFTNHETMINPAHAIARGLEKVLYSYYPLAGRLRVPTGVIERGNLELVCNGLGAMFVEAQANVSLAELKKLDKVYWSELHYDYVGDASTEVCPLVVQVTTLTCGGFVLSVRVLQSLCDSAGMLHFLHAWSEMTKSSSQLIAVTTPIWGGTIPSQLPHWPQKFHFPSLEMAAHGPAEYVHVNDHHKLQYVETRDPSYGESVYGDHKSHYLDRRERPHYEDVHVHSSDHTLPYMEARDQPFHDNVHGLSNITISLEYLSHLKDSIRINCNKFEALAALIWRERTRVLALPLSSEVVLFFPAPVPHDVHVAFYGQYGFNCMVSAQAGDLVQSDLSEVVRMIQMAKVDLVDNFLECMRRFAQLHRNATKRAPPHVLIFTVLWEGVEEIDFGLGSLPFAPDATRLHSPVNVAAVTGGLEETIEIVMTNAPITLTEKIHHHMLPHTPLLSDSKL
ncbi:hypothetical protein GOP47_0013232 [Adiantum capillus-veneris]|uniref:Uncharacterized protein n=1 Tax=Adiantum capillus-veneris TaxID=13818 RepID=A0A9D4UNU3_ADICA|nr:hypothetical protein GOP47_0013232 [Adiantum capillus-veneris]